MFSIYSRWWCISASLPRYCLRLCPSHCALLPNRPLLYKIWRNCISLWAPHCTVHRQRLSSDPAVLQAAQRRRRSAHAFIFTGGLLCNPVCCSGVNGFGCIVKHVAKRNVQLTGPFIQRSWETWNLPPSHTCCCSQKLPSLDEGCALCQPIAFLRDGF